MVFLDESLFGSDASLATRCTRCGACRQQCDFLKKNGTPGEIAQQISRTPVEKWPDPFECSLCGLCGGICPESLKPESFFLQMRESFEQTGLLDLKPYKPVLGYEWMGGSSLLSYIKLPVGGDTVLFPGCALPSQRSGTVRRLFDRLETVVPNIGIALGCCLKPSHDLGRKSYFADRFGGLLERLESAGVKRIVTACPNCQKIFLQHGSAFTIVTAYELLADNRVKPAEGRRRTAVVHDPCPQRFDSDVQQSVRQLANQCGYDLLEIPGQGKRTRCCGEGGMVKFVKPEFADKWTADRRKALGNHKVLTSCAGCVNYLGKDNDVSHILDVLLDSTPKVALKPPLTYAARVLLKLWFMKRLA